MLSTIIGAIVRVTPSYAGRWQLSIFTNNKEYGGPEELDPSVVKFVLLGFKPLGLLLDALGHAGLPPAECFELRCLKGLLDNIIFIGTEASILLGLWIIIIVLGVVFVPVDHIVGVIIAGTDVIAGVLVAGAILSGIVVGSITVFSAAIACATIAGAPITAAPTSLFGGLSASSSVLGGVHRVDIIGGGSGPRAGMSDGTR